jgi:hypothetical protein
MGKLYRLGGTGRKSGQGPELAQTPAALGAPATIKPGAGKKSDAGPAIIAAAVVRAGAKADCALPSGAAALAAASELRAFFGDSRLVAVALRRLGGKRSESRHDYVGVVFDDFRRQLGQEFRLAFGAAAIESQIPAFGMAELIEPRLHDRRIQRERTSPVVARTASGHQARPPVGPKKHAVLFPCF